MYIFKQLHRNVTQLNPHNFFVFAFITDILIFIEHPVDADDRLPPSGENGN